jgi:hypothetical protein
VGRKRVNGGEGWLKKEESGVKWGIEQGYTLTAFTPWGRGLPDVSWHPRTPP